MFVRLISLVPLMGIECVEQPCPHALGDVAYKQGERLAVFNRLEDRSQRRALLLVASILRLASKGIASFLEYRSHLTVIPNLDLSLHGLIEKKFVCERNLGRGVKIGIYDMRWEATSPAYVILLGAVAFLQQTKLPNIPT